MSARQHKRAQRGLDIRTKAFDGLRPEQQRGRKRPGSLNTKRSAYTKAKSR